nr:alpha/beta hydrolase [Secundilactobacillus odoratitofui]
MKFVTSDHVTLTYSDAGSGRPVLLLNGIGSYREIWQPTAQFLLAEGYRVICLDARNQGASQRTIKGRRISRHAVDVAELIGQLGLTDVIGIGNSMGASTLFAYVSLFGTKPFSAIIDIDQSPKMIRDETWPYGFKDLSWANFPDYLKLPFGSATATPVDSAVRQSVQEARAAHPYEVSENEPCLVDHAFQDWRDIILKLDVPLLVVAGAQSPYFDSAFAAATAKLAPKGQSAVIKNAGHIVMTEQPALFNDLIKKWLKTV